MPTITVPEAARLLHVAASSIRNYCKNDAFRSFFSAGATPPTGTARQLSPNDVRVLAFIAHSTGDGIDLATVAQRLQDGDLDSFEWDQGEAQGEAQAGNALTVINQYRSDLQEAHAAQLELKDQVADLRAELATARAQLDAAQDELTRLRRPWWSRLFRR
jgi:DNA-binding transcriptional MerR regulator